MDGTLAHSVQQMNTENMFLMSGDPQTTEVSKEIYIGGEVLTKVEAESKEVAGFSLTENDLKEE